MLDWLFLAKYCFYRLRCSLLKVYRYCFLLRFYYYILNRPQTSSALIFQRFSFFLGLFKVVFYWFFQIAKIRQIFHNDMFRKLNYSPFVLNRRHYWTIFSIFLLNDIFWVLADFLLVIVKHKDALWFFHWRWNLSFNQIFLVIDYDNLI